MADDPYRFLYSNERETMAVLNHKVNSSILRNQTFMLLNPIATHGL